MQFLVAASLHGFVSESLWLRLLFPPLVLFFESWPDSLLFILVLRTLPRPLPNLPPSLRRLCIRTGGAACSETKGFPLGGWEVDRQSRVQ